jgi:hypothetical protein
MDLGSQIRDPEKPIPYPGSMGQKGTGSRIRIRKTDYVLYLRSSVSDPHHFDADSDPDPACHFDADPDTDPASHLDADPDPNPTFHIDGDPDLG